jgi:RNA polymerase sigma factor (sigma-70 family)
MKRVLRGIVWDSFTASVTNNVDGPSYVQWERRMSVQDGTLVIGALNGDRSAFAELYDRRARLIRAVCYDETRDSDVAAELTQEVFLRAYRNLRRLHVPDKFTVWLIGIAKQVCREWRRKRGREKRAMAGFVEERSLADHRVDPPDERLMELRDAIAGKTVPGVCPQPLTQQERLALHAFYLQGRDVEEARGVLGLSRSVFYRVLSSACERLHMILEGETGRGAGCTSNRAPGSSEVRP